MIKIFGAGMAGLLAANVLRRFDPIVYEAQPSLPNNHEALLRFRSDAVARALGIPFRKVTVLKSIVYKGRHYDRSDIRFRNMYSHKLVGEYWPSRSIANLETVERYIAPPDLIAQMSKGLLIEYSRSMSSFDLDRNRRIMEAGDSTTEMPDQIISTVPMPVLRDIAGEPKMEFKSQPIYSLVVDITHPYCDVYGTIYYPDPDVPYYRASITGSRLIVEFLLPHQGSSVPMVSNIMEDFGISLGGHLLTDFHQPKLQKYGKITPVSDPERQHFIVSMTDNYRVYSLGRFATWRNILLDDVVKDVSRIEEWMQKRIKYQRRLASR